MIRSVRLAVTLAATIGLLASAASEARAASTFTVTGFGDAGGACVGTVCPTLRVAVATASQPQNIGSTVQLAAGTYTLGGSGSPGGPLTIPADLTLVGAGESATTIEQTSSGAGVLTASNLTATVTIAQLTVTGGDAVGLPGTPGALPGPGTPATNGGPGGDAVGGISAAGALILDDVAVTGNTATGGSGGLAYGVASPGAGGLAVGGVRADGPLTINGGEVADNTSGGGTGGTAVDQATGGAGGNAVAGIDVDGAGTAVALSGVRVTGNSADGGWGGATGGNMHDEGPGGDGFGGLAALAAATVTISGSHLDANTATGGLGGPLVPGAGGGNGGSAYGGGLYTAQATVTAEGDTFDTDTASGGGGSASEIGSLASGNGGEGAGGGLAVLGIGSLVLRDSSIVQDSATGGTAGITYLGPAGNGGDGLGGGLYLTTTGTLVNVTLAEDVATGAAAGTTGLNAPTAGVPGRGIGGATTVQGYGGLTLDSDTLASDAVDTIGGGSTYGADLDVGGGATSTRTSDTIFGVGIGGPACSIFGGGFTDAGHNLEATTTCGLSAAGDQSGVDPRLGALADNGGPGPTLALGATSPARGAGGACVDPSRSGSPPLTVDERGAARPAACDIGAYQTEPPALAGAPTIAGPAVVGQAVTCTSAGVSGDGPPAQAWAWSENGVAVPGATAATYTPGAGEIGATLTCTQTASNPYGSVRATSSGVAVVAAPPAGGGGGASGGPGSTPPSPTPGSGRFAGVRLHATRLRSRGGGRVLVPLSCPAATGVVRCTVDARLYPAPATRRARSPRASRRALRLLASGHAVITAGHTGMLLLRLNRAGRRRLAHRPVNARLILSSRDAAGARVHRTVAVRVLA